jgi:protein subunit release factor A
MNYKDLEIKTTRGSGKGGQHRNKVETAVIVKHLPSGLSVRCESERSQIMNKEMAIKILYSKLNKIKDNYNKKKLNDSLINQHGKGLRADKDRVYIEKLNEVVDYKNKITFNLQHYLKGKWNWI